jgi:hypothetical protein
MLVWTNVVDWGLRRLAQQHRVLPFPDNHAHGGVLDVLVLVLLIDELDENERIDPPSPRFLAVHARAFVDSNSSPMLRSHCCFIVWLEASWRSCSSNECDAVGAVDVAVRGCGDGAVCAFLQVYRRWVQKATVLCLAAQRSASSLPYLIPGSAGAWDANAPKEAGSVAQLRDS